MRLFVAINLPGSLRESLASWARNAGTCLPGSRWLEPANLHITVRFLGDVEALLSRRIGGELRAVVKDHRSMRLSLSDHATLPANARARIAYIGLAPSPRLVSLQAAISQRLEGRLQLPSERRTYHPHITLARSRQGWTRVASDRWREIGCPHRGDAFEVIYVDLMESLLSPSGAKYQVVESFPLEN